MPFCLLLEAALQPCGWIRAQHTDRVEARLSRPTVDGSDWLAGSVATVYGVPADCCDAEIAVKDAAAALWRTHPSDVLWDPIEGCARHGADPNIVAAVSIDRSDETRTVFALARKEPPT